VEQRVKQSSGTIRAVHVFFAPDQYTDACTLADSHHASCSYLLLKNHSKLCARNYWKRNILLIQMRAGLRQMIPTSSSLTDKRQRWREREKEHNGARESDLKKQKKKGERMHIQKQKEKT
jgi:hypothetical protein